MVNNDITPKAERQPTAVPSQVPKGTPNDKATGVPTMAIAIAWPYCSGVTIRRAYPASRLQAKPADMPAMKRAIIVRTISCESAVIELKTRKPTIVSNKTLRRRHPCVAMLRGIAAISEPIA